MSHRHPRGGPLLCAAVLGAMLLAACGGGDTKTVAATTTSAVTAASTTSFTTVATTTVSTARSSAAVCALITPIEVKAALKVTVAAGELVPGTPPVCKLSAADGSTTVTVTRIDPVGDLIKTTLASDPKAKALTGTGDAAVDQAYMGQITLQFRGVGVVIHATPAPPLAALVEMARVAGGKL
jgi:hypothetical protein